MTPLFRAAAFALVCVGLAASINTAHAVDDEAIETVMEDWTDQLVAGDYDAWIGYWTKDGMLMPPGHAPVIGHDALIAYAEDDFAGAGSFSFSDWSIEVGGRLAVVTNDIKWGDKSYKQVVVLRKEDGTWKVHIVMFNSGV